MIQSQECMKVNKMTIQTMMTTHQNIILKTHTITYRQHKREKNESDKYTRIEEINITAEMNASNREDENAEDGEKKSGQIKDTIYDQDQKTQYNLQ